MQRAGDLEIAYRWTTSWAGVAVIVAGPPTAQRVLFIQRTRRQGDPWSGDMGFPGGLAEAEDEDPLATVRREVTEEIAVGLPMPDRKLPSLWVWHPKGRLARVVPFVFRLPEVPPLVLEAREVAAAHWIPWDHLRTRRERRWIWIRGRVPWFAVLWAWEGQRIWGLTGRMVSDLLKAYANEPS